MNDGVFQVVFPDYMRPQLEAWLLTCNASLSPDMRKVFGTEDDVPTHVLVIPARRK